jgi:hypothetical protein
MEPSYTLDTPPTSDPVYPYERNRTIVWLCLVM